MSYITAEEWELSSLFGVEPKRLDPGVPWPYNDFVYEVQQSEMSLSVAVAPACKDVRIILKSGSVSLSLTLLSCASATRKASLMALRRSGAWNLRCR